MDFEEKLLPREIKCLNCKIELELEDSERGQKKITCPECKNVIDMRSFSSNTNQRDVEIEKMQFNSAKTRLLPLIFTVLGSILLPILTSPPNWLIETIQKGWWGRVFTLGRAASIGALIGFIIGYILFFSIQKKKWSIVADDQSNKKLNALFYFFSILFSLAPAFHLIGSVQHIILIQHYSGIGSGYDLFARTTLLFLSLFVVSNLLFDKNKTKIAMFSYFLSALVFQIARPLLVKSGSPDIWIFIPVPFYIGFITWVVLIYLTNIFMKNLLTPQLKYFLKNKFEPSEKLPEEIICPHCAEELELEIKEREEKKFTCPECNHFIDFTNFFEEDKSEVNKKLPEEIMCPKCNEELELEEKERDERKFICPECKELIYVN